jgi:hypothetical protein
VTVTFLRFGDRTVKMRRMLPRVLADDFVDAAHLVFAGHERQQSARCAGIDATGTRCGNSRADVSPAQFSFIPNGGG